MLFLIVASAFSTTDRCDGAVLFLCWIAAAYDDDCCDNLMASVLNKMITNYLLSLHIYSDPELLTVWFSP